MALRVRLEHVNKIFPPDVVAAEDITLEVAPGELFFLLGPSGCGKTTVLRMLAGFEEPTSGRIFFGESDVTEVPANRRGCGMVFQSYALWPHMSVYQNVEYGLRVRGVPKAQRRASVTEALAVVRMEAYADARPNQLSGGQQQRVALARALVIRPDVLLLDEPLSNLDAKLRLEMRSELLRIHAQVGTTTIYVTHDQEEALSLARRMAVMNRGRIVQVGSPREIYASPATRFVADFIGETNLLDGTVAESSPSGVRLSTALGDVLSSRRAGGPGASVTLSIRPEALSVAPGEAPGHNRFVGVVEQAMYLGDREQLRVRVSDDVLLKAISREGTAHGFAPGDRVTLSVDPDAVVVLEE